MRSRRRPTGRHMGDSATQVGPWSRLRQTLRSPVHQRRIVQAAADALALAVALVFATLLRHDGHVSEVNMHGLLLLTLPTMAVLLAIGTRFGLYTGRWRYGSFEEISALARTIGLTTIAVLVMDTFFGRQAP